MSLEPTFKDYAIPTVLSGVVVGFVPTEQIFPYVLTVPMITTALTAMFAPKHIKVGGMALLAGVGVYAHSFHNHQQGFERGYEAASKNEVLIDSAKLVDKDNDGVEELYVRTTQNFTKPHKLVINPLSDGTGEYVPVDYAIKLEQNALEDRLFDIRTNAQAQISAKYSVE